MLQSAKKDEKMELKDTLLFQNLNDAEIQRILHCSHAKTLSFPKGQTIVYPDDKPAVLYLILEGTVILEQYNYMGKPMNIEYRSAGSLFGETDVFLDKKAFGYTVRTESPCRILTADRSFFFRTCEKSCEHHSQAIFNMLHIFALDNHQKQERLDLLTCGELEQRLARYLLENRTGADTVPLSMNRSELAAYLNTTRPSLSRTLSGLQNQGVLRITGRNQIKILDSDTLQDIADGL